MLYYQFKLSIRRLLWPKFSVPKRKYLIDNRLNSSQFVLPIRFVVTILLENMSLIKILTTGDGYIKRIVLLPRYRGVTTDGVWIWYWIYWPLEYTTRNNSLQITDTQTSVLNLLTDPVAVSWQRFLPREILQLPALRSSSHSRSCGTPVN
jgi:hypothetical protein